MGKGSVQLKTLSPQRTYDQAVYGGAIYGCHMQNLAMLIINPHCLGPTLMITDHGSHCNMDLFVTDKAVLGSKA